MSSNLPEPLVYGQAFNDGGRFHLLGGHNGAGPYDANYIYDAVYGTWTAEPRLPAGLERYGMAVFDSLVYLLGGRGLGGFPSSNVCLIYNLNSKTFSYGATLPYSVMDAGCASLGGEVYLLGGRREETPPPPVNGITNMVQIYNPVANSWRLGTSLPTKVCFPVAVTHEGAIYLMGGTDSAYITSNKMYRYTVLAVTNVNFGPYEDLLNVIDHTPSVYWSYSSFAMYPQDSYEIAVGNDTNWATAELWNPAPFTSPDTFVVYNGSALVDGMTYYLRLRVFNGAIWSPWFNSSFRMNSLPSVPVQSSPINNQVAGSMPTLWLLNSTDAEGDAITYNFAGFHDTDCVAGGPIIELNNVPGGVDSTGGQVTTPLAENCHYWWRARAFDGYEYSEWSPLCELLCRWIA